MDEKKVYQKIIDRPIKPKTFRLKIENETKVENRRKDFEKIYPSTGLSNADIVNIVIDKKVEEISDLDILNELEKKL